MQAALLAILAAHAVASPIIATPPVPDGYGGPVASPVAIGAAELVGSQFILRPRFLEPDGQPGVVDVLPGGSAELRWASPVNAAGVFLLGYGADGNGELKLQGWLAGELVGEVARPAIFPRHLSHLFEADPAWVIDRLTWDGGGSVVGVQYQSVPEPSGIVLALVGVAAVLGLNRVTRRERAPANG